MLLRASRRGVVVAIAGLLLAATGALAVAHLRPGALYTGRDAQCGSSVRGTTCVFKFRAGENGRSLRFVGTTVIDTWGCRGGGGEALLGGRADGATPLPVIRLGRNGKLHGSVAFVLHPTGAPPQHYTSSVTGHISRAGKAAVLTFQIAFGSSRSPCTTQPVTVTDGGPGLGAAHAAAGHHGCGQVVVTAGGRTLVGDRFSVYQGVGCRHARAIVRSFLQEGHGPGACTQGCRVGYRWLCFYEGAKDRYGYAHDCFSYPQYPAEALGVHPGPGFFYYERVRSG